MNKKIIKFLYYTAWIIGIVAAFVLIYGIIKSLFGK